MNFNEIDNHIIPMKAFKLNWRFTERKYDLLPEKHLNELKPLDNEASEFLDKYISKVELHNQFPFKRGFFKNIDKAEILEENEKEIRKWLYRRALPFDKTVLLSWDGDTSMKTKWKFVLKYWDSVFYVGSDDLTVFDESLEWALLFFHENEIYWGTNKKYK
ncbi:hypothetical protein [Xanthovirga aplysinae]|uniref:hypothetical protein n=1 Tax=Xanthovirga aplysinae TaxID=2529853 RepID=UPI0012BD6631|nr:hypothetical protein [Xanthovirga aplysinae]MTI31455.1 hypothetical protein [Xanthovirga aplysinae]